MQRIVSAILVLLLSVPTFSVGISGQSARPYIHNAINAISAMPHAWQQQIGQFLASPNFTAAQLLGALSALNEQSPYKASHLVAPAEQIAAVLNAERSLTEQGALATAQKLGELTIVLAPYLGSEREELIDAAKQARTELAEEKRHSLDTSLRRTAQALGMSTELAGLGPSDSSPVASVAASGKKLPGEWELKPTQSAAATLKERRNPLKYPLGIADKVRLQFRGETLEVYFLGGKNDFFFFHEQESGRLIIISEQDISLLDTEGNSIKKEKVQRILTLEKQVGPTCAVHSTINCLVVLKEFGLLKESELKTSLEKNPKAVFDSLNAVNEEAKGLMIAGMPLFSGVAFQSELRQSVLKSRGLKAQITHSMWLLKRHLKKGFPAIIDLQVKPGSRQIEVLHKETYISQEASTLLPSKRGDSDSLGGHSVVAIAYIETGFFSGHILILDSATAEFHLWDIRKMKAAMKGYGSITLIQP